jgi:hypothetical protein
LSRKKGDRKHVSSGKGGRGHSQESDRPGEDEPHGEGGPDEAASFIAETAGDLVRLARSHWLEMLSHLLRMAELEAERVPPAARQAEIVEIASGLLVYLVT